MAISVVVLFLILENRMHTICRLEALLKSRKKERWNQSNMYSNACLRMCSMVGIKHYQRDRMGSGALRHSRVDIIHNDL